MKDTENRVRAVIKHDNKILCFRANENNKYYDTSNYFLPGGHIQEGECSHDAVIRELKEEILGIASILSCDILGVVELKWYDNSDKSHIEINFIYEIQVDYVDSPENVTVLDNYLNAEWIDEIDIKEGRITLLPSEIAQNFNSWHSVDSEIRRRLVFSAGF